MSVTVQIPTPLRRFTDEQAVVTVEGGTVGEALASLVDKHRALEPHLFADGKLRSFVNVFLGDEDVRFLQRDRTPLSAGDRLSIIPSIAGGAP